MSTFLIISPEPWAAQAVSKHHYALTLASRCHEVLFLNPPSTSPQFTISQVEGTNVRVIDSPPVARGLRFLPAGIRRLLEARWLARLEARLGVHVEAVWLFENSRFFDLAFAAERLKIYHQVDLNQAFYPKVAASSADLCLCTTDVLYERLVQWNSRVHKIHHGTPLVPAPLRLDDLQRERFRHNTINAAYVGNLAMTYLDVDLLLRTIQQHPQVSFHLIGSYTDESPLYRASEGLPNVFWWGQQPSTLIPSLLDEVDVVMCTYDASRYRDQLASPHKFMEYFASGKTIVSTYTDEYKDKRDLLCMVDESRDYISLFSEVVANLPVYNSPARRERRKAFAAMHSYDAQLDRIADLVGQVAPRHAALFRTAATADIVESVS